MEREIPKTFKLVLMRNNHLFIAGVIIVIGAILRMIDIAVPDMATDEAQFALGASAAQPPLGLALFRTIHLLFGPNMIAVRSVSVLMGVASLPLIYLIANEIDGRKTGILAMGIAAIFPSHIFFSRLAYLSVPLQFSWLLLLFVFLKSRKSPTSGWVIALFASSVFCTFVKTQGLLLPAALLGGQLIEALLQWKINGGRVQKVMTTHNSQLTALWLSLIPITLYILTSPGIIATLTQYGGNQYGIADPMRRFLSLMNVWWNMLGLFLVAIVISLKEIRRIPWPLLTLIIIGVMIGLLLGPNHPYYTTHLLPLCIPLAFVIHRWKISLLRYAACSILTIYTVMVLGPGWLSPLSFELFQKPGMWNTHGEAIRILFENEHTVSVMGSPGHQYRWYLPQQVLLTSSPDEIRTHFAIILNPDVWQRNDNRKVYEISDREDLIVVTLDE